MRSERHEMPAAPGSCTDCGAAAVHKENTEPESAATHVETREQTS